MIYEYVPLISLEELLSSSASQGGIAKGSSETSDVPVASSKTHKNEHLTGSHH
jgi:hypothetical protein